mmetsp:Transcript_21845/g.52191  ORF Transcript_21845/g.52191 Transcript_21845/m.52191 type:complete len:190 (-) Transcript_21845:240-809(-)
MEFVVRTARDDFVLYQHLAATDPVLTKACTSGVSYVLGDLLAQAYQGRSLSGVDLARTARSGVAGFCIHGPFVHFWIQWAEANLAFGGAWYSTLVKMAVDQTVWSLFLNSLYTMAILAIQGRRPQQIREEVDATWWAALSTGWRFWPFVHMVTFSSFVAPELKLLFIDVMEIAWVTILATIVNREDERR